MCPSSEQSFGDSTSAAPSTQPLRLVLASGSPRRRELLEGLGFELELAPPPDSVEESVDLGGVEWQKVAEVLARAKCQTVQRENSVVLAADTVVVLDGEILGKPVDATECRQQLTQLSGRTHVVVTGYCLNLAGELHSGSVQTLVTFRSLAPADIDAYIATGEPFDKAGGYGIQGRGALLVETINGCYFNVVGLPLSTIGAALERLGFSAWVPC